MLTILFLCSTALVGIALVRSGLRSESTTLERWAAAGICALIVAVAVSWALALLGLLTRTGLLASAAVISAVAAWQLFRKRRARTPTAGRASLPGFRLAAAALFPVLLWSVFAFYRGNRLSVSNFDALSYHLPKSVLLMESKGYGFIRLPDYRLNYPCNYELLLADSIILENSDRMTGPFSALLFGLFLLLAATLAQQWWGRDPVLIATVTLLVASTPVLLLHSSTHKNDLLMSVCLLSGFLWLGRWLKERSGFVLALAVASFAMALGTKGQAIFAAAAAVPPFVVGWFRTPLSDAGQNLRRTGWLVLGCVAAALLLGGVPYGVDFAKTGNPLGFPGNAIQQPGYGDWSNLLTFTTLLAIVPFGSSRWTIEVPWRGQDWFWPKYDMYFSSFGVHWLIAVLVLLTLAVDRRAWQAFRGVPLETRLVGGMAVLGWAAMIPMRLRPIGHFAGFPRTMIFVVPVVMTAFAGALLSRSSKLTSARPANRILVLVIAVGLFVSQAVPCATKDSYGPIQALSTFGGTRRIYFTENVGFHRAPHLLDRIAGDHDVVAVDAGLFTWLYPLWGKHFTRSVQILPDSRLESIRPDVRWVVIDRSLGVDGWDDPTFHDMSEVLRTQKRCPMPEEVLLLERLESDPGFVRVYYDPDGNQAIFARKPVNLTTGQPDAGPGTER